MDAPAAKRIQSASFALARPRLSILIPFHRYDPCPLVQRLDALTQGAGATVEILLLDDGGGDEVLLQAVAGVVAALAAPAQLTVLSVNQGRARARNRLLAEARARHLLLMDCDMAPVGSAFLERYLDLVETDVAVAFGGFSVEDGPRTSPFALHRALQQRGECLPAAVRRLQPEKYVYTSNLLVRKDVLAEAPFDEGFVGWGWEDVEWGMRVAARYEIHQVENPALHLGLDTASALAGKYEQSVLNFARVLARHPGLLRRYPSYRIARIMAALPGRCAPLGGWRGLFKRIALNARAPLGLRVLAMKLYRAALYADALRPAASTAATPAAKPAAKPAV